MSNSRVIPAPPATVWAALNDPETLKACLPGCESLERVDETTWKAVMAAKVGPVSARFSGNMHIEDSTPPTGYTLRFEGQGGAAGFANGEARVDLAPADTSSTLAAIPREGADRRQARADRVAAHRRCRRQDRRRFLRALLRAARARAGRHRRGDGRGRRGGGGPRARQRRLDPLGVARRSSRRSSAYLAVRGFRF